MKPKMGKITEEEASDLHDAVDKASRKRKGTVADAAKQARAKAAAARQGQAQGERSMGAKQRRQAR